MSDPISLTELYPELKSVKFVKNQFNIAKDNRLKIFNQNKSMTLDDLFDTWNNSVLESSNLEQSDSSSVENDDGAGSETELILKSPTKKNIFKEANHLLEVLKENQVFKNSALPSSIQ
jgi:hypothetical protein